MKDFRPDLNKVHRPVPPSASEIRTLLAAPPRTVTQRSFQDVILIVATTGIRPSELRHAKWADINFESRCLRVHSKSLAGDRLVPFGPNVLNRLIERREQFPDGEYVFGPRPDLLHRVSRQLHKASGANCGPRINLNMIRHFFFAQWVALGGDAVSLAKIAGWSMARVLSFQVFTHRRTSESDKSIQEQIENSISC